jgi:hypothetical protein
MFANEFEFIPKSRHNPLNPMTPFDARRQRGVTVVGRQKAR